MPLQVEPLTSTFGVIRHASNGELISDLDINRVMSLYISSGAVLFRGFKVTKSEFVALSNRFTTTLEHPVRTPEEEPGVKGEIVYDVDPDKAGGPRSLHAEASDTGVALGMCWFFCETASPSGGETTVADGVEILRRLSPATRRLFTSTRIMYKYIFSEAEWQSIFQTSDRALVEKTAAEVGRVTSRFRNDGTLDLIHMTSAICPTRYRQEDAFINAVPEYLRVMRGPAVARSAAVLLEDESRIPAEADLDIKRVCEESEYPIRWEDGDVVMVDNTRILHGRREWPLEHPRLVHARFGEPKF